MPFSHKRIADPIHGTVPISKLELEILECKSFQRLRNVKQLGLAYLVYPGADYSRFSHGLGACHMAGMVLENLRERNELKSLWKKDSEIERQTQIYRLAALLHDIGHYPFSHTTEHAIKDFYSAKFLSDAGTVGENQISEKKTQKSTKKISAAAENTLTKKAVLKHEAVGKAILENDEEITKVLAENGIQADEIVSIFRKQLGSEKLFLRNLVAADLDVDRIDYLQRTAHHTSLPYGSVDVRYLMSQMTLDSEHRLALTSKAMRTAEHLLLGRYFDYMQVSYHKTVAGLEWLLSDVITALLDRNLLQCSEEDILQKIRLGLWPEFDDVHVMDLIRKLTVSDDTLSTKAKALLLRKPPLTAISVECIEPREFETSFKKACADISAKLPSLASSLKIPIERWHLWQRQLDFTETGDGTKDDEEYAALCEKAVRILDGKGTSESTPIIEKHSSVLRVLGNYKLFTARVYVLLKDDEKNKREKICAKIQNEFAEQLNALRGGVGRKAICQACLKPCKACTCDEA